VLVQCQKTAKIPSTIARFLTEKKAVCSNFVPGQARVLSMPPIDSPLRAVSSWQEWWPWPNDHVDRKFRVPLVNDGLRHLVPLPEQRRQRFLQPSPRRRMKVTRETTQKKAVGSNFVPGQARVLSMPPIDSPLRAVSSKRGWWPWPNCQW
jgi:hypothetical protein